MKGFECVRLAPCAIQLYKQRGSVSFEYKRTKEIDKVIERTKKNHCEEVFVCEFENI